MTFPVSVVRFNYIEM